MRYQWQQIDSGREFTIRYQLTDTQTGQVICVFDQPTNGIEAPVVPQDSDDKQVAGVYCPATDAMAAAASATTSIPTIAFAGIAVAVWWFFLRKK